MSEPKLVWQIPFGSTRPDGVTANRVPFELQEASASSVVDWLKRKEAIDYEAAHRKYRNIENDGDNIPTFRGIKAIVDAALPGESS